MQIKIRQFDREDIPKKVEWINNPENNKYLHYNLPLEIKKTEEWFEKNKGRTDRYDCIIEVDEIPCGTIGLLNIDQKNEKAEFYIAMGEPALKGKGISTEASKQLLQYAFRTLNLNRIYLFTEPENVALQRLAEKIGFEKEGYIRQDLRSKEKTVDRLIYGLLRENF